MRKIGRVFTTYYSSVASGASVGSASTVVSGVNLVDRASGWAESLDGASQCRQELASVGRRVSVGSLSSVTITDPKVTLGSPDRLSVFLSSHPEMHGRQTYDSSYGWSKEDGLELYDIVSTVDPKSLLGRTPEYRNARKFYRHWCQVCRAGE